MKTVSEMIELVDAMEVDVIETMTDLKKQYLDRSTQEESGMISFMNESRVPLQDCEDLQEEYNRKVKEWKNKGVSKKTLDRLEKQVDEDIEEYLNQHGWKFIKEKTYIAPEDYCEE